MLVTGATERRDAWIALIEVMQALKPELVVAGRRMPTSANDASALEYPKSYLKKFERILTARQATPSTCE